MKMNRRQAMRAALGALFGAPLLAALPKPAPANTLPFTTLPTNMYIRGPRYRVMFDRIVTPRFSKDVDELKVWDMDLEL